MAAPSFIATQIRDRALVANPGCYSTTVILALKPLLAAGWVDLDRGIISDAKSGVSGAGKAPTPKTHYMNAADNLSAYGVFGHRHTGELLEQLGLDRSQIIFTPHLLPIPRGILSTIYVRIQARRRRPTKSTRSIATSTRTAPWCASSATDSCRRFSIRCAPIFATSALNFDSDGRRCVIVSCLDNLLKGASGQAVENMNLMCGWDEAEGLA